MCPARCFIPASWDRRTSSTKALAVIATIHTLPASSLGEGLPLGAYAAQLRDSEARQEELARRNMELLRGSLFPVLDDLFQWEEERTGPGRCWPGSAGCSPGSRCRRSRRNI